MKSKQVSPPVPVGGAPILTWDLDGGYPILLMEKGYPGYPHLYLGWGTPILTWEGGTRPSWPGKGVPPIATWEGGTRPSWPGKGVPPILTWDGVPPSWPGMGYPLVLTWDGVLPILTWDEVLPILTWEGGTLQLARWGYPSVLMDGQTPVKTLPFPFLRNAGGK